MKYTKIFCQKHIASFIFRCSYMLLWFGFSVSEPIRYHLYMCGGNLAKLGLYVSGNTFCMKDYNSFMLFEFMKLLTKRT